MVGAAPFLQQSPVSAPGQPLSNPLPNLPLPSQFPIFPTPPAFRGFNAAGSPTFSGPLLALNPFDRTLSTPYVGNWNLTVQRELPSHFSFEIGYIGTQGVKLLQSLQRNQARLANANNPIIVGGARGIPVTKLITNSALDNNARAGVLGLSSTGLNTVTENGHSTYHALVATLNRRAANMFIQAPYTYSKSIDNNSGNLTS